MAKKTIPKMPKAAKYILLSKKIPLPEDGKFRKHIISAFLNRATRVSCRPCGFYAAPAFYFQPATIVRENRNLRRIKKKLAKFSQMS